jgi:hypothetical protein
VILNDDTTRCHTGSFTQQLRGVICVMEYVYEEHAVKGTVGKRDIAAVIG